jgi:hypothetical protein
MKNEIDLKIKVLSEERDERKYKNNKHFMTRRLKTKKDKINTYSKCKNKTK